MYLRRRDLAMPCRRDSRRQDCLHREPDRTSRTICVQPSAVVSSLSLEIAAARRSGHGTEKRRVVVANLRSAAARCERTGSGDAFQTNVTWSAVRPFAPIPGHSFQKRPTLESAGRLWKETADSGNSACVWFPEWNASAALFTAFRNAFSSLWGSPPLGNRAGFHGVSKRIQLRGGVCGWVESRPVFTAI